MDSLSSIHLIGFGSQGSAWDKVLRARTSLKVHVYLRSKRESFRELSELRTAVETDRAPRAVIAMLVPDSQIGPIYREHLANLDRPLLLVLAHGYAIYSGDLKFENPHHQAALFAPKAIGPKIVEASEKYFPDTHTLVAAVTENVSRDPDLLQLVQGLGFSVSNLIRTSFETETVGDLISEQTLLCGGVFSLLEFTVNQMRKAGVPEELIREECLTELELIAGMLRSRGPAQTFKAISQNAKAGTVAVRQSFLNSDFQHSLSALCEEIANKKFCDFEKQPNTKREIEHFAHTLEALI